MDRSKSKTRAKSKLKKAKSKTRTAKSKIPKKKATGAKKRGASAIKKKFKKSVNAKKKPKKSVARKKTAKKSVSKKPKKKAKSTLKKKPKTKKKKITKKKKSKDPEPVFQQKKLTLESDDEPAIRAPNGKFDLGEFQHEIIEQQKKNEGIVGTRFSSNLMDFKDRKMGVVREIVHNYEIKEGPQEQETIMEIESNLNNHKNNTNSHKIIQNGGSSGNIKLANLLPEDLFKERDEKLSKQLSNFQEVVMNGLTQLTDLAKKSKEDPNQNPNNSDQVQGIVENIMKNIQNNGLGQPANKLSQGSEPAVQDLKIPEHHQFRNSDSNPITFTNSEKKNYSGENVVTNFENLEKEGLKESYVGDHEGAKLNTLITNHGDLKDIFIKRGTIAVSNPTQDYTKFIRASLNDGDKDKKGPKKIEKIPEHITPEHVQQTGIGILGKPEVSPGGRNNPFNNEMLKSEPKNWAHNEAFKQTQQFGENPENPQSLVARQISSGKIINNFNQNFLEQGVDRLKVNMDILKHHDQLSTERNNLNPPELRQNNRTSIGQSQGSKAKLHENALAQSESKASNQIDDKLMEEKAEKQFNNYMNTSQRDKSRTRKGKDFRTTMSNIYSDIDKTLDYIEVEQMNDSERDKNKKRFSYKGLDGFSDPIEQNDSEKVQEDSNEGLERKMKRFNSQVKLPLENMVKEEEKRSQQMEVEVEVVEVKKEIKLQNEPVEIKKFKSPIPTILKQPRLKEEKVINEPQKEIESNILQKFIKPAPKIYKRQKQGEKFLILAQDKDDLETRSYYSRKNNAHHSKNRAPSVSTASHAGRIKKFSDDDWRSYPDRIRNRPQSAKPERVTNKKAFKLSDDLGFGNEKPWRENLKKRSEIRSEIAVGSTLPKPAYGTAPQRETEKVVEGGNMLSQFSRVPTHAGTIRSSIDTQVEQISKSPHNKSFGKKRFTRKSNKKDPELQTIKANASRPFDTPTVYSRSLTQKESKFRFLRRKKPQRDDNEQRISSTEPQSPELSIGNRHSNRRINWTIEKRKQRKPKPSQRKNRFAQRSEIDSQNEQSEPAAQSKIGTMSVDDMEAKLRILFKKMLVYGSKIETIKLKIDKMNGETSCYALYRRFCDPNSGELSLNGLKNLLQALNFPLKHKMLVKMMIYLSKFEPQGIDQELMHQRGINTGSLPPSQTDVYIESPYMHQSEVHSRNLFEQRANQMASSMNPNVQNQVRRRGNTVQSRMFGSIEGTLDTPQSPELITLKYESFRQLFTSHKIQIPEIYLFCNWERNGQNGEVQIPESEYYLMRQILMLFQKQLKDMTRIMTALRPYTAEQMFEYLSSYSPDHIQPKNESSHMPTQITFSVQSNSRSNNTNSAVRIPNSPIPSFSNNNYNGPYSPKTQGTRSVRFNTKALGGQKSNPNFYENNRLLGSARVSQNRELYAPSQKRALSVNVWNIKNFLEIQNVQYLEEDLMLLMNTLASSEGMLQESTFYQFVYSPIWTL